MLLEKVRQWPLSTAIPELSLRACRHHSQSVHSVRDHVISHVTWPENTCISCDRGWESLSTFCCSILIQVHSYSTTARKYPGIVSRSKACGNIGPFDTSLKHDHCARNVTLHCVLGLSAFNLGTEKFD